MAESSSHHYAFQLVASGPLESELLGSFRRAFPGIDLVMVTAYRVDRDRPYLGEQFNVIMQALGVQAFLLPGPLTYPASDARIVVTPDLAEINVGTQVQLVGPTEWEMRSVDSPILALATELRVPKGETLSESEQGRQTISEKEGVLLSAAGMIAAVGGREFLASRLFTHFLDLVSEERKIIYHVTVPIYFERPELDIPARRRLAEIDLRLATLQSGDDRERQIASRVRQSLMWFSRAAVTDIDGARSETFLNLWISIEALVARDGDKALYQLTSSLAESYGLPDPAGEGARGVKKALRLGHLYAVRKAVAHQGNRAVSESIV